MTETGSDLEQTSSGYALSSVSSTPAEIYGPGDIAVLHCRIKRVRTGSFDLEVMANRQVIVLSVLQSEVTNLLPRPPQVGETMIWESRSGLRSSPIWVEVRAIDGDVAWVVCQDGLQKGHRFNASIAELRRSGSRPSTVSAAAQEGTAVGYGDDYGKP